MYNLIKGERNGTIALIHLKNILQTFPFVCFMRIIGDIARFSPARDATLQDPTTDFFCYVELYRFILYFFFFYLFLVYARAQEK